jgi:hypothetical protein
MQDPSRVPVGFTTKLGASVTATGLAAAIVAFVTGDRSEQTVGTLTAAGVAVLAFAITAIGRYAQAHAQIKAAAPAQPVIGRALTSAAAGEPVQIALGDQSNRIPGTGIEFRGDGGTSSVSVPVSGSTMTFGPPSPRVDPPASAVDDEPGDPFSAVPDLAVVADPTEPDQGDPQTRSDDAASVVA